MRQGSNVDDYTDMLRQLALQTGIDRFLRVEGTPMSLDAQLGRAAAAT